MSFLITLFSEAKKASSRNIILISKQEEEMGKDAEYYFIQGKVVSGEFNLHFRDPYSPFMAFGTSLVSLIKKKIA